MSRLFNVMQTGDVLTTNGMTTNSNSGNEVLNCFFKMGGSRTMSDDAIEKMFISAFRENETLALKAMFYNRDIRGGQGERRSFRIMFRWLCFVEPDVAKRLIQFVPVYGRWDDLLVGLQSKVTLDIAEFILSALRRGDKLCAKWMPRENKSGGETAKLLAMLWELSPKQYRKLLAGNTKVVETYMCQNEWPAINYNQVPSKASHLHRDAFLKHDEDRYREWLGNLSKVDKNGKPLAKVNAGAIFPHDVIRPYFEHGFSSTDLMIEAQWKALPNYSPSGNKVLSVCDVSGSMTGLPMLVCVALGMYTAERNNGIFKNSFITFSARPELQVLNGKTLRERVNQLSHAHWDMNTNLEAVFKLILQSAVRSMLPEKDMPDTILILSDMQFDGCVTNHNNSAIQMIRREYNDHGYKMPNVIFWNLNTSIGLPAKFDESGTALISGFSPSVLKSILNGEIDPIKQMLAILMSERYAEIK